MSSSSTNYSQGGSPHQHRRRRKSWHPKELSRKNRLSQPPPRQPSWPPRIPPLVFHPPGDPDPVVPSSHHSNPSASQRSGSKDQERTGSRESGGVKREVRETSSRDSTRRHERRESGHASPTRQQGQGHGAANTSSKLLELRNPDYKSTTPPEVKEKTYRGDKESERKNKQGKSRRESRNATNSSSNNSGKALYSKPLPLNLENLRTKQEEFITCGQRSEKEDQGESEEGTEIDGLKSELDRKLGNMNRTYLEGMLPESAMSGFWREDQVRKGEEERDAGMKNSKRGFGRK